ncbi:dephospho-CoA kinase [Marinomonas transparens]|uniref:Dephospho-CoA kinase n=1 Tax=Marinomonas transparens TaxID=2795388 RepID=A0A934JL37_9GAMM|nr:dephospho-CoA kinase [Marinomonas transparens]MBJ7538125.1 dephospho-CoA kinase [Marinomonas transparens]
MTHNPPIVGLTGGIGSGKSTVAQLFNTLGIQSVDADDVARIVVQSGSHCLKKIQQRYGDRILLEDGTLNRKTLRDIIFDRAEERVWLEELTHPVIREEIRRQLSSVSSSYVLLVHPLLFETHQNEMCELIVAIDVPTELQLERVINRDNSTLDKVTKIMATQLPNEKRKSRADLVLENTGNTVDLSAKVLELHKKILELLQCRKAIP